MARDLAKINSENHISASDTDTDSINTISINVDLVSNNSNTNHTQQTTRLFTPRLSPISSLEPPTSPLELSLPRILHLLPLVLLPLKTRNLLQDPRHRSQQSSSGTLPSLTSNIRDRIILNRGWLRKRIIRSRGGIIRSWSPYQIHPRPIPTFQSSHFGQCILYRSRSSKLRRPTHLPYRKSSEHYCPMVYPRPQISSRRSDWSPMEAIPPFHDFLRRLVMTLHIVK